MNMSSFTLRSQFNFPKHTKSKLNTTPTSNPSHLIPTKTTLSYQNHPTKTSQIKKPLTFQHKPKSQNQIIIKKEDFQAVLPNGYSRFVIVGAVSIGFVLVLMGFDDQKALAFGPEGPLMEEFWDNVRRYGLYALTVSTGALYTIFQPILELLKNPISAILILTILGGGFFIVTQVVSAMIGVTEFAYDYSY